MNSILLQSGRLHLEGDVLLTGSKSESNRALILEAISEGVIRVENLSDAEDTQTLQQILQLIKDTASNTPTDRITLDIGPAGTAMRFLTAFLSIQKGQFELTGSERMQERPIGLLVDGLKELGAHITYSRKTGYPPLSIDGQPETIANREVSIKGNVSSQFLSALLLIGAKLPMGLKLSIEGELTSKPYLTMTLDMLSTCGIQYTWDKNQITIENQPFQSSTLFVEPDWSAASYWYSLLALSDSGSLFLKGLREDSLQGDRAIADWMLPLGIKTTFQQQGILLEKIEVTLQDGDRMDLHECPDLAQTLIVCAAALGKNASFTGLHTLRIKETDRIAALQNELRKFGVDLMADAQDKVFTLDVSKKRPIREDEIITIATYEDHRMAMAFAPLIAHYGHLEIQEPQVVGKSYPDFWLHLNQKGIQTINKTL